MLRDSVADIAELVAEVFQRAPTLGGECYSARLQRAGSKRGRRFNGHPPLGVNATVEWELYRGFTISGGFNGHPPLGVNATDTVGETERRICRFQRAPTLGGECYWLENEYRVETRVPVSTGTHPWG